MTEVVAVDLGLSVKWASMNVGATSEGDYDLHSRENKQETREFIPEIF
jgi:hypothetical protein